MSLSSSEALPPFLRRRSTEQIVASTMLATAQEDAEVFEEHDTKCWRCLDGWCTSIGVPRAAHEDTLTFIPTHTLEAAAEVADVNAGVAPLHRFDDLTICRITGDSKALNRVVGPIAQDDAAAQEEVEGFADDGKLHYTGTAAPWQTEHPYFAISRAEIDTHGYDLGAGSAGLNLVDRDGKLRGVLAGRRRFDRDAILFFNIHPVASAVRLSITSPAEHGNIFSSLLYELNLADVVLFTAREGRTFATQLGLQPGTPMYRVAFAFQQCDEQWIEDHPGSTSKGSLLDRFEGSTDLAVKAVQSWHDKLEAARADDGKSEEPFLSLLADIKPGVTELQVVHPNGGVAALSPADRYAVAILAHLRDDTHRFIRDAFTVANVQVCELVLATYYELKRVIINFGRGI